MSKHRGTLEVDRIQYRLDDLSTGGATNRLCYAYTPKCSCDWEGDPSAMKEKAEDRLVVHMKTAHR